MSDPGNKQIGKFATYAFALFLCALMWHFSMKRSADGWWEAREEPPLAAWAVLMPAIGLCLGIQIDPGAIGNLVQGKKSDDEV